MADLQNSKPLDHAAPAMSSPSKASQTPGQSKRNTRQRSKQHHPPQQMDGTVSDSVTYPSSTPPAKRTPKPRHQSVALGAPPPNTMPHHPANFVHDHKQRPASLGGNMLPATPFKEQAYAGPTFQASPAPSSLPVPKFFSRSVPNVAGQSSLAQRMEAEQTPEKESSPEPDVVDSNLPDRNNQKSPLDVFFKADRDEKQRSRSGLSPELERKQNVPNAQEHRGSQHSSTGIFLRDANGSHGDMLSPKSTPAIGQRPVTSPHVGTHNTSSANASDTESDREAQTKALKALIFNMDGAPPQPQQSYTPPRDPFNSYGPYHVYQTPSPSQRSTSGPSTPAPSSETQYFNPNYHYGNQRNLSPLFKAASGRNDIPPPRPSGLRQHELATADSASDPQVQHRQNPPTADPHAFSRDFLQQHINGSGAGDALPVQNSGVASALPSGTAQRSNNSQMNGASNVARTRDTKGMEDDLRRMLNLNVVSN